MALGKELFEIIDEFLDVEISPSEASKKILEDFIERFDRYFKKALADYRLDPVKALYLNIGFPLNGHIEVFSLFFEKVFVEDIGIISLLEDLKNNLNSFNTSIKLPIIYNFLKHLERFRNLISIDRIILIPHKNLWERFNFNIPNPYDERFSKFLEIIVRKLRLAGINLQPFYLRNLFASCFDSSTPISDDFGFIINLFKALISAERFGKEVNLVRVDEVIEGQGIISEMKIVNLDKILDNFEDYFANTRFLDLSYLWWRIKSKRLDSIRELKNFVMMIHKLYKRVSLRFLDTLKILKSLLILEPKSECLFKLIISKFVSLDDVLKEDNLIDVRFLKIPKDRRTKNIFVGLLDREERIFEIRKILKRIKI